MTIYEFLGAVHERYAPRSYLEIGIRRGLSLALSRTRTVAVDPDFEITAELACDLRIVKVTSDEFFAQPAWEKHFPEGVVDLAFVDGLHHAESALRDFINVERRTAWTSVILVDDVLPRTRARAARERGEMTAWSGDVYKLRAVLARLRPDLLLLVLDTAPSGVLAVLGPDSENRVLEKQYDELVDELVQPDPQDVPVSVLRGDGALDPAVFSAGDVWGLLREARDSGLRRAEGWDAVRRAAASASHPAPLRAIPPACLDGCSALPTDEARGPVRRGLQRFRRGLRSS